MARKMSPHDLQPSLTDLRRLLTSYRRLEGKLRKLQEAAAPALSQLIALRYQEWESTPDGRTSVLRLNAEQLDEIIQRLDPLIPQKILKDLA